MGTTSPGGGGLCGDGTSRDGYLWGSEVKRWMRGVQYRSATERWREHLDDVLKVHGSTETIFRDPKIGPEVSAYSPLFQLEGLIDPRLEPGDLARLRGVHVDIMVHVDFEPYGPLPRY